MKNLLTELECKVELKRFLPEQNLDSSLVRKSRYIARQTSKEGVDDKKSDFM